MPAGALERAVELLGRLGETGPELTVAQLAADAGMPTSTAYRLLAELEQYGLVQRSSDRTVALGTRLVALGRTAEAGLQERLVAPAAAVMARLSERTGETALLTAPCALDGIVLHAVEGQVHSVRLSYTLFRRAPMHRGASGKVMAAYLEPAERARLLAAVDDPELAAELDRIQVAGYVVTRGELHDGAAGPGRRRAGGRGRGARGVPRHRRLSTRRGGRRGSGQTSASAAGSGAPSSATVGSIASSKTIADSAS